MGVFKWLRREREGDKETSTGSSLPRDPENIRTEAYKRDLAEFQARRSHRPELPDTPVKKSRCGRNSLPVSCTDCTSPAPDNTFNYEKKSAMKYKKNKHKRTKSAEEGTSYDGVPNIQFLFQNQVFMPGNVFAQASFSEPAKTKRRYSHTAVRAKYDDFKLVRKQINFNEEENGVDSSPLFYQNNCLPVDSENFLKGSKSDVEEVDNPKGMGDKLSSRNVEVSDDCGDNLEEVMSDLEIPGQWTDEKFKWNSVNSRRSEDSKSDNSAYGLPVVTLSNLDITIENHKKWNYGHWGTIPIQIKKLPGVTMDQVKRKQNVEVNILRKCRHPNIILLMGLYYEIHNTIHIVCERCVDTLFGILHVQGRILSAQTAVQYVADIASALVFLHMQGYIHTELNSICIMITNHDTAKLVDLTPCAKYPGAKSKKMDRKQRIYDYEPHYVNVGEANSEAMLDYKPLISNTASEAYLSSYSVPKQHSIYRNSEHYRWQAPELFTPDGNEKVHPCSRSDVYSLTMILWECCNAAVPWKRLSYEKIEELYTVWKARVHLPVDGTYPGCLLDLLQSGLKLDRAQRMDIVTFAERLQMVKRNLDSLEYIVIPARLSKNKPKSPIAWDPQTPTDSSSQSPLPRNLLHMADVHRTRSSTTDSSEKDCSKGSEPSPVYETIEQCTNNDMYATLYESNRKMSAIKDLKEINIPKLSEEEFSSACSTPIMKVKACLREIGTPGATLHKSDSTEYCSILSPGTRFCNLDSKDCTDVGGAVQNQATKLLSRSFTPKSYKPLHIRVPEFKNLEGLKSLTRDGNAFGANNSSYNFDIQSYSLPNTPIARSNKLRKNAWLSGELGVSDNYGRRKDISEQRPEGNKDPKQGKYETPSTEITSTHLKGHRTQDTEDSLKQDIDSPETDGDVILVKRLNTKHAEEAIPHSWHLKQLESQDFIPSKQDEESLLHVNVKPLVAIHERWIQEAGRKSGRSMSLPEDNRSQIPVFKPASHRIDHFQKSLPLLTANRAEGKPFSFTASTSSNSSGQSRDDTHSAHFSQVRDSIVKCMNLQTKDAEQQTSKICMTPERSNSEPKIDQATDTNGIEEFIKELIRKEIRQFTHTSENFPAEREPQEKVINNRAVNIMEALKAGENSTEVHANYKDSPLKSFSRVKINGNNKPLLQITFSRTGENCLQVLDNCVNVTICDTSSSKDKINNSNDDVQSLDDYQTNSLKRCQAFNALQEARSTEDLYIDDDFSTQMQENFGGKVKLIPLHGSLHEILCEKQDDCCLIKVKQENGCDTVYFRCDNSDTESRDALDGIVRDNAQDTVVFKRSISLVEERIKRVFPKEKEKRSRMPNNRSTDQNDPKETSPRRPTSEILSRSIDRNTRFLSNSSPSLIKIGERPNEVELNIENVMCYQDSSSDESLKCQTDEDFESLERKIEEDVAKGTFFCGCLEKISEENLSVINEELMDRDFTNEKLYIE